jgi:hypothetical protein
MRKGGRSAGGSAAIQGGRACESDGDAGAGLHLPLPATGGGGVVDRGARGQAGCRGMAAGRGSHHPPIRMGVSGETLCRWFHGQRRSWQSGFGGAARNASVPTTWAPPRQREMMSWAELCMCPRASNDEKA